MKSLWFFVLLLSICFEVIFSKGETTHPNRPISRKTHVTGTGKPTFKRGEGLGTGPVGPGYPRNIFKNSNSKK